MWCVICVQCQSEFLKLNMDHREQLGIQGDHLSHSSANVLGTGVINVSNTDSSTHSWRKSWPRGLMLFKEVTFCSSLHFNCLLNVNVLGLQMCHQVRHPWNCTTAGNLLLTNLACCKLCIFGDGEILPHWWLLDMMMWHSWISDVCVYCGNHVTPAKCYFGRCLLPMEAPGRKKLLVWEYITITKDAKFAGCQIVNTADEGLHGGNIPQSIVDWYCYVIAHNQFAYIGWRGPLSANSDCQSNYRCNFMRTV